MPGGPKFAKYIKQVRTLGDSQFKKKKKKKLPSLSYMTQS
jgi:hypothetical protein